MQHCYGNRSLPQNVAQQRKTLLGLRRGHLVRKRSTNGRRLLSHGNRHGLSVQRQPSRALEGHPAESLLPPSHLRNMFNCFRCATVALIRHQLVFGILSLGFNCTMFVAFLFLENIDHTCHQSAPSRWPQSKSHSAPASSKFHWSLGGVTMTMTHPNEVSTRVNLALRTRTKGRDSLEKNLLMLVNPA